MRLLLPVLFAATSALSLLAAPPPGVKPPGHEFALPVRPTAPGAPRVFEHGGEAGPDESFYLVGEDLTGELSAWGVSAANPGGEEIKLRVQFSSSRHLAATVSERAQDGPVVVWIKNAAGYSDPLVLNAPQAWWCAREPSTGRVRVFGRNLAQRPDFRQAHVYLQAPAGQGAWLEGVSSGKHSLSFALPQPVQPGDYLIWVHAGDGGGLGWSGPLVLPVESGTVQAGTPRELEPGADIQAALDEAGAAGGGEIRLRGRHFTFSSTLRIPAKVTLAGQGMESTTVRLLHDPTASFPRLGSAGWDLSPSAIHSAGDCIEYTLEAPRAGDWTVWLRYATDMSPWGQSGVSDRMTLAADDGPPVPLLHLENTGGFGAYRWTRSASIKLKAGKQKLLWKNAKGGGVSLDAFIFALDPAFAPSSSPTALPQRSPEVLVLQAEDCTRFLSREGSLPGGDRAAVWLAGDGAAIRDLTVLGNARVNLGIALRSPEPQQWVRDCRVERVRMAGCDGKQAENCGIHLRNASRALISANEFWGRAPVFLSGARQSWLLDNRLVSVTRFGGNAEAAILGRNEPIEECVIEGNRVISPPGAEAGGPTARRLIWLSTGHGSISHNWIAGNGTGGVPEAGSPRFGGVAGTDQNVGEMILFEANHRTMFFGALAGADEQSVTLPQTLPSTPDDRLGSVKREHLAHDEQGRETPFWPPETDDGSAEPPLGEYYVSVMAGRGQGQTRRVLRREGERLHLDRPWRVAPQAGSLVVIGTGYYRNHIVGNQAADGMTGIQLWISCIENVVAGNTIARQRKPGLFLYANGSTLASSMPRTWNRGLSPLFWNIVEGNRTEECSAGALVTSGDAPGLPIEFPRALGNVLRHNSFLRSRTDGVILTSRKPASGVKDAAASISGTLVEFNVVRDALTAYHAAGGCDGVVFRRNHAYFWYPVSLSPQAQVAFQVDDLATTAAIEQNTVEGTQGVGDRAIIEVKKPEPPAAAPAAKP